MRGGRVGGGLVVIGGGGSCQVLVRDGNLVHLVMSIIISIIRGMVVYGVYVVIAAGAPWRHINLLDLPIN